MNYDNYYDPRLLALEDLIYKNESTDIYKKSEKNIRLSVSEAKSIKKAYDKGILKTNVKWHPLFINLFIERGGWSSLSLGDYASLLKEHKTQFGVNITSRSLSVFITNIRTRLGFLAFEKPKKRQRSWEERIKHFTLGEWDFILNKCHRMDYILCIYKVYCYGWDTDYIESKIGRDAFKAFLCRSLGILSEKKSEENTKKKK